MFVIDHNKNGYRVVLGIEESVLLAKLAIGNGVKDCDMLAACLTKGMREYNAQLIQTAQHERERRAAELAANNNNIG